MAGFALYSHTKIQKFREHAQPRVISLTASGGGLGSGGELAPLKGPAPVLRTSSSSSAERV